MLERGGRRLFVLRGTGLKPLQIPWLQRPAAHMGASGEEIAEVADGLIRRSAQNNLR